MTTSPTLAGLDSTFETKGSMLSGFDSRFETTSPTLAGLDSTFEMTPATVASFDSTFEMTPATVPSLDSTLEMTPATVPSLDSTLEMTPATVPSLVSTLEMTPATVSGLVPTLEMPPATVSGLVATLEMTPAPVLGLVATCSTTRARSATIAAMPGERVTHSDEAEWKTRKKRIDPRLDSLGWTKLTPGTAALHPYRTEEEETDNGPADYGLWLNSDLVGIVEAKKVTVGPQNVLTQAARYSRGARNTKFDHDGHKVPFLYSTNGEVFWFHDVRHHHSRSRRIAGFHTPNALKELLARDFAADCAKLLALPNDDPRLRDYQRDANTAVERAISERKRNLLVAMA